MLEPRQTSSLITRRDPTPQLAERFAPGWWEEMIGPGRGGFDWRRLPTSDYISRGCSKSNVRPHTQGTCTLFCLFASWPLHEICLIGSSDVKDFNADARHCLRTRVFWYGTDGHRCEFS